MNRSSFLVVLSLFVVGGWVALAGAQGEGHGEKMGPRASRGTPDATGLQVVTVQILLDRAGFSPGSIDGWLGGNTRGAIRAFQEARNLTPTGVVDAATWQALGGGSSEPLAGYTITDQDVAGPFVSVPADMMEKAKLQTLGYSSPLEALGERFHVDPRLLATLNPGARSAAGEAVRVPKVTPTELSAAAVRAELKPTAMAGTSRGIVTGTTGRTGVTDRTSPQEVTVVVTKAASALTVEGPNQKVLVYAPVTVGSEYDPLPIGKWKVTGVSLYPTFNYNPALFWDADPSHSKARIPPGPNNPVGVAWIDLSREHYGIHGTPEPERIAHSESHGCIRLTNWDIVRVVRLVRTGTPVIFR
ncbi:MAG: murein L,D-transpeptidase [Acidobacteria bacterium]|nr:murein L,D-transpeptidase [Acidobacteriota bacterium]